MLLLTSITDAVQVVTGSAGSVTMYCCWVDYNGSTIVPDHAPLTAAVTTATTTTVSGTVPASTQRNITKVSISNTHASISNLITVNLTNGTNTVNLFDVTLAPNETLGLNEDGVWTYYDAAGKQWVVGLTTGPVSATTLTASGAVTLSPASANVVISPTGTGTVTISPASTVAISPTGALTINPTAASTINNTSVGATTRSTGAFSLAGFGGASAAAALATWAACTATVASATITGGTVLTTPAAGAVESDSINPYWTTNTTDGRARIPIEQYFKLTANGTAFNTISNFFGTTSNISLVASAFYEIEIECYFTKTTAEAVTWTFTNSAAPTSMNISMDLSPIAGVTAPGAATTSNYRMDAQNVTTAAYTFTTGVLATGATHYAKFNVKLANGTGTSLKIQAACTTASGITPLRGSRWKSSRLPTGNTGTFAA